jgi:Na+/H+-dicarboxylate symporter
VTAAPPRPIASPGAELTVVGLGVVAVGLAFVAPVVAAALGLSTAAFGASCARRRLGRRPWVVTGIVLAALATLVGLGIIVLGTPATEEVSLGLPAAFAASD